MVVVLAMSAALVVGAGILLVNQAAISAILVITLPGLSQGGTLDRLFDALIGAAVALVLSQVLFPRDPVRQMGRAAGRVLDELALALDETAVALADADQGAAEHALERVRALDDAIGAFYDAVAVGRENAWLSPARRRRSLGHLRAYADAARQVDYAVRNTRILARNAAQAARTGPPGPGAGRRGVHPGRRRARPGPRAGHPGPGGRGDALPGPAGGRPGHLGAGPAQRPAHEHGRGPGPGHGHRPAARDGPGHPGRAAHAAGRVAVTPARGRRR